MALYRSNFNPSGTLFGGTFVKGTDDRPPHVRQSSSLDKAKWRSDPSFKWSRQAAVEFGGASKLAAHIYIGLGGIRHLCQPYTHNRIAALIRSTSYHLREQKHKRIQERQAQRAANPDTSAMPGCNAGAQLPNPTETGSKFRRLQTFPAPIAAATLHGLQLGTAGRSPKPHPGQEHPRPTPIGAALQPIAITGTEGCYTLHGLRSAHAAMPLLKPNQCREFRIHIAIIALADYALDPASISHDLRRADYHFQRAASDFNSHYLNPSGWINPEHLPAQPDGDTLLLGPIDFPEYTTSNPDQRLIVVVAIEWRQRTGHRVAKLRSCSTVTVVEVLGLHQGQPHTIATNKHPLSLKPRYKRKLRRTHPDSPLGRPIRVPTRTQRVGLALRKLHLRQ